MKRPTYKMMKIKLADCKPHADAEAYSASSEDRTALANSVGEAGVLSPIAVIPDEGNEECCQCGNVANSKTNGQLETGNTGNNQKWFVIDGIGRMNALIAAGETETEAQVFDLGDLSVAEFVISKNSMMRKVTTGTRVMAYLKCHEREVLAAADPEKYQRRTGNEGNFKGRDRARPSHAVSHETALEKGWSAKEIAERLGVSKNDVLAGIELLKATVEAGDRPNAVRPSNLEVQYEQGDLFDTMEAILRGETPIRRWKAAAGGKVSKTGGKAAADYTAIAIRLVKSLPGVWANWQSVPMEIRGAILGEFRRALEYLPEDFRAVIEEEVQPRPAKGKRR